MPASWGVRAPKEHHPLTKRFAYSLGLIGALIFTLAGTLAPVRAVPTASQLVINEVFAPSAAVPSNQYFELYNGTAVSIDLSSYVVYNKGGFDQLNVLPNP